MVADRTTLRGGSGVGDRNRRSRDFEKKAMKAARGNLWPVEGARSYGTIPQIHSNCTVALRSRMISTLIP
jgi:hypothetical protein